MLGYFGDVYEFFGLGLVKRSFGVVVGFVGLVNVNVVGYVVVFLFIDEGFGKGFECVEVLCDVIYW